ncbi:hypothetical protein [Nocardia sp. NPDC060259]|uniref:hypothetical protein n=1 Tax=Nocardia sp. NPDC060259 TaxID=3347088 RepID=UPI003661E8EE
MLRTDAERAETLAAAKGALRPGGEAVTSVSTLRFDEILDAPDRPASNGVFVAGRS